MLAIVADLLTLSRVAAAGILVWLGITAGASGVGAAALVTVLAWTTDQLDGWVARRSPTPTRLGPYDFPIDVVFYAGIVTYMTTAGFVPLGVSLGFVVLAVIAWLVTRRKAVGILALRIVDLTCAAVIFRYAPAIGVLLLVWVAALAVIYRRRLAERVPRWLVELRSTIRGRQGG
jgi:phosphatidylglycerophosphate synthase